MTSLGTRTALLFSLLSATTAAEARITCGDVFANSVRNISVSTRTTIEKDHVFDQHCSSSGELHQSSAGLDLTIPVKGIVVGFSGSQADARQAMENFCTQHAQSRESRSALFELENTVVVDALRSFTECRALEINETFISHALVEPRAVIVTVDFNPARTNLAFRGITYDPEVAECRSTGFSEDGSSEKVDASTKELTVARPFSIICERTGTQTESGATKFPRFVLGLDTNHGPYTVAMPLEELAGFDLASTYKRNFELLTSEVQKLETDISMKAAAIAAYENRLANATAEVRVVAQGQHARGSPWEHVACPQNGGNVAAHAQSVCGSRKLALSPALLSHDGNRCGYTYYAYACLKLD